MFCSRCGSNIPDNSAFCPMCGNSAAQPAPAAPQVEAAPVRAVLERLISVLRDNLFLWICILVTGSTAISLMGGALPLIDVLAAIFMWFVYAQSRKGIVDLGKMRCVSGVVFASYVMNYVLAGLLILLGVIFVVLGLFSNDALSLLTDSIDFGASTDAIFELFYLGSSISISMLFAFIAIVLVVAAVVVIVFNIFGWGRIHKFVQSVYKSGEADRFEFVFADSARIWLIVFGVFSAISVLSSGDVYAALASGCKAAAMFLGAMVVKKYFLNNQYNPNNYTL